MADVRISSVTVTSSGGRGDIKVSAVTVTSVPTILEPFQDVTLPSGTWTRTSGVTVSIIGGVSFTAPALPAGGSLVLTETAGGTLTFTVLPHTFFTSIAGVVRPVVWATAGSQTPGTVFGSGTYGTATYGTATYA